MIKKHQLLRGKFTALAVLRKLLKTEELESERCGKEHFMGQQIAVSSPSLMFCEALQLLKNTNKI